MNKLLFASALVLASLTSAQAQSVCKGLEQSACASVQIDGVSVCRWQGEYYTTGGVRGNYCTTSNKKMTKEQFERLQAAITDGSLIQAPVTTPTSN